MRRNIAVVEDEEAIRENLCATIRRHGFDAQPFPDRVAAEQAFEAALPDLAIIDIGLGDEPEGGFELCRRLRARSSRLPILFLTARDSEIDAVSGLRLGADDFLNKDISSAHLMARIQALFRRADAAREESAAADESLCRGALRIDRQRLEVRWNGRTVPLTVTEFWIVHALAERPGHVKTRGQLMDAANLFIDDATVTSHVKRIRRKFEAVDPDFAALSTVHGAGYRWQDGSRAAP
ncbi:MAG: proteobacterial dedicated sortase system response regulator [Wenzhouxiangellaceae bacterium]|nr:proteobacterial dedicated sortase system response regulator [Wenzhouxiangellaceae bacterium]